ncbi:hypothetical protein PROFUN_01944 [Planoprotostelium fungivorum]|uniref:Uncharacterized protein n=1 Tax=Planoprotostelium fungivorum TaxID=1890364 RepID=A0A2P6NAX6_9EUKA|nr:hypothetical protein PROFUN_01944 [Planoprotostelium fungivorum]
MTLYDMTNIPSNIQLTKVHKQEEDQITDERVAGVIRDSGRAA